MIIDVCSKCGCTTDKYERSIDTDNWVKCELTDIMRERQCCFNCAFWFEKVGLKKSGRKDIIICEGNHYIFKPDSESGPFKGFGGHEFFFIRLNGEIIKTKNLWHQGEIPLHFRDDLPDNAIRIYEKIVQLRGKYERFPRKIKKAVDKAGIRARVKTFESGGYKCILSELNPDAEIRGLELIEPLFINKYGGPNIKVNKWIRRGINHFSKRYKKEINDSVELSLLIRNIK